MATNAQIGSKTTLSYSTDAGVTFTEFAEYKSIDGIGLKRPEVDVTHLQSDAVERIGGLPDGETVNVMFNMVPLNIDIVKGLVDAGDLITFQVIFPGTLPTFTFDIIPLEYKIDKITPTGALDVTMTGRITGNITDV